MSFWKGKLKSESRRCDETPHLLTNDDWFGTEVHLFNWDGRFVITSVNINSRGSVEISLIERAAFLERTRADAD